MDPDSQHIEELDTKIRLLGTHAQNETFVEQVNDILKFVSHLDAATADTRILTGVFPEIENRFNRVFTDNVSLFETLDDELLAVLIKENLEVVFQLTEIVQELLDNFCKNAPVALTNINLLLTYLPKYIQSFAEHWKNSSDAYKETFEKEISKIFAIMKNLYSRFLYRLEFLINVPENDNEIRLLADALAIICEMRKALCDMDPTAIIPSWNCFSTLTAKYSTLMGVCLDIRIPVKLLTEDVCQIMEALDHDMETLRNHLNIPIFLTKILIKTTDVFCEQINNFLSELLMFYVRVLSFTPGYLAYRLFSTEALLIIETELFQILDEFLQHLVMEQSIFKDNLDKISNRLNTEDICNKYPLGFLHLLSKIFDIIGDVSFDSSVMLINLMEDVFDILHYCQKELFIDSYDGGIYQNLIINISKAILLHDTNMHSTEMLLKQLLQDNVFVAVLALEVYVLVVSNIPPEECLLLLMNLLYSVDELVYGFLTYRPEIVYLKLLLQRIFTIVPDILKEQVIKLFPSGQYIQIWRFLGFNSLPSHLVDQILDHGLRSTSAYIKCASQSFTDDVALNIVEGLDLISTTNNLNIASEPRFSEVIWFVEKFWSSDINTEILDNNIFKYFVSKIGSLTACCIQSSSLNPHVVFSKLKFLLNNQSYWIPVFKMISSSLNSLSLIETQINTKQELLSQIAGTILLAVKHKGLLRDVYLEELNKLNYSHNDILNMLCEVDNLNVNLAEQIFEYIENLRKTEELINIEHYNNISRFTHMCLPWNNNISNNDPFPPTKRFKFEERVEHLNNIPTVPISTKKTKKINEVPKIKQQENINPSTNINDDVEDDSAASDVIDRLKWEVKCLMKICYREKLTAKNCADLRVLMSKISSVMR